MGASKACPASVTRSRSRMPFISQHPIEDRSNSPADLAGGFLDRIALDCQFAATEKVPVNARTVQVQPCGVAKNLSDGIHLYTDESRVGNRQKNKPGKQLRACEDRCK